MRRACFAPISSVRRAPSVPATGGRRSSCARTAPAGPAGCRDGGAAARSWWRRRVLPPGPLRLCDAPFTAIAGNIRPLLYRGATHGCEGDGWSDRFVSEFFLKGATVCAYAPETGCGGLKLSGTVSMFRRGRTITGMASSGRGLFGRRVLRGFVWLTVVALLVHQTVGGCTCPHHSAAKAGGGMPVGQQRASDASPSFHGAAHAPGPAQGSGAAAAGHSGHGPIGPAAPCCGAMPCAGCCLPLGSAVVILAVLLSGLPMAGARLSPPRRLRRGARAFRHHPALPRAPPL